MNKFLLGTVALVTLGLAAPAVAADLSPRTYTKAPAYVAAPIYNWTGFYVGGHVGGTFSNSNNFSGGGEDGRFLGGVQVGGDYQFAPNWVLGIEGQYSWASNSDSRNTYGYSRSQDGLASVTGRLGYTWGPAMLYVKGGYAYADYSDNFAVPGGLYSVSGGSKNGYTVGGGLEYLFSQNWSGKVEYQYYNFGKTDFQNNLVTIGSFDHDQHVIKAGLNYRFNLGGGMLGKY
jgi:outer membrane immunogenic protein